MLLYNFIKLADPLEIPPIRPYVKDNVLHINSFRDEWDEIATVVHDWVDEDAGPRLCFLQSHCGDFLATMYNTHISQPVVKYNKLMSKQVTWGDGKPEVTSLLFMPYKHEGCWQDPVHDSNWIAFAGMSHQATIAHDVLELANTMLRKDEAEYIVELDFHRYTPYMLPYFYDELVDHKHYTIDEFECMVESGDWCDRPSMPEFTEVCELRGDYEWSDTWLKTINTITAFLPLDDPDRDFSLIGWYGLANYEIIRERLKRVVVRVSKRV